ncbi:hypothetical protein P4O66_021430 [Electrophorus voltai]|uniref:Uncharacterized protein n=1 Tax=Electrophorus voltai TaxID=2609070 RepID=A0AAD8ZSV9_9TELE|nr:hypothetical protein P4O66_021430 [Electrophorus voltai]
MDSRANTETSLTAADVGWLEEPLEMQKCGQQAEVSNLSQHGSTAALSALFVATAVEALILSHSNGTVGHRRDACCSLFPVGGLDELYHQVSAAEGGSSAYRSCYVVKLPT